MLDVDKHGFFYQLIVQTTLAVQLFFCVSGYLSARQLLRAYQNNKLRRGRRPFASD
jgi:peptidoglycan/LPS O-acetylase OafA/YrhL